MRIDLFIDREDRRLTRKLVRRLPQGVVRIGEPARLEDGQERFIGWAINHPELNEIDAIRLRYVVSVLTSDTDDTTLGSLELTDAASVRALRDAIDAVPEVDTAIRAYRRALRDSQV